jgi:tRNA G18 (ribose-2'-O)-methylase SpoU
MDSAAGYLIIFNITKKSNIGNLLRTANAFGISEVLVVGKRRFHEFGAFGTSGATTKRHFYRLEDACAYLRRLDCTICGIEITDEAISVCRAPFRGNTAFMVGNEGTGLTLEQRKLCDYFVYIPQFGSGASLNVNVATGIVLQRFAEWAGWEENDRQHEKFTKHEH